jgi:hypothetical protein
VAVSRPANQRRAFRRQETKFLSVENPGVESCIPCITPYVAG